MKQNDHAQDTRTTIKKRHGAYLPHWTRDGAWYSVTFRLWDSLPQDVIESWLFERKNIVKTAEQMKRPLSEHEERRLAHLFSEKIELYLDAGYGSCYMNDNRVAKTVADAIRHFEGERYDLAGWCVMPNHVYDHLIRDEADFHHSIRYALNNPIKAGLKNWKWVGLGEFGKRELSAR
jgi:hypothetical protein